MYDYNEAAREYVLSYFIESFTTEEAAAFSIQNPENFEKILTKVLGGAVAEAIHDIIDDIGVMTMNGEPWK